MRITAGPLLLALVLSGCDNVSPAPTIDATSDESLKQTTQEVRESLPESERGEFDEALKIVAFSQVDMKDLMAQGATGADIVQNKLKDSLQGKTASQVVAEADRITMERDLKQKQQGLEEIKELEQKRKDAEAAGEELAKFEVLRSRFRMEERQYTGKQPVVELTVKNGTSYAVSRAHFEGTIASPGRSVPWLKESFNYSISGGLEPGEEQSWSLAPNSYSAWGRVEAPADAIFTAVVVRLDGPDGKAILSTKGFTDRDQKRLSELKDKYGVGADANAL